MIYILVSQNKGYGGAAINAEYFYKYLLSLNFKAQIFYDGIIEGDHIEVPEKCFCFNYLTPILAREKWPKMIIYYCVTGCTNDPMELTAIQACNFILPNSYLMENYLLDNYPEYSVKISRPFFMTQYCIPSPKIIEKKYDVIFVTSNTRRKKKNADFVYKLYHGLSKIQKVICGKSKIKCDMPNYHDFGFVDVEQCHRLIGESRILIIPSIFESASITLDVALKYNTIPLCSKNVGAAYKLPPWYIVNDQDDWSKTILFLLNEKHDNLNYYSIENTQLLPYCEELTIKPKVKFFYDISQIDGGATINSKKILSYFNNNIIFTEDNDYDIIICKGYKSFKYITDTQSRPRPRPILYIPSGLRHFSKTCNQLKKWNQISEFNTQFIPVDDPVLCQESCNKNCSCEQFCLQTSTWVLPHSKLMRDLLLKFYPMYSSKILHEINLSNIPIKPIIIKKDIDVLFAACDWSRPIKNNNLVCQIIDNIKDKLVIMKISTPDHQEFLTYLARSKIYCCCSFFEASSNTMYEAKQLGCKIIASENVDNNCNTEIIVPSKSFNDSQYWTDKIFELMELNPIPLNIIHNYNQLPNILNSLTVNNSPLNNAIIAYSLTPPEWNIYSQDKYDGQLTHIQTTSPTQILHHVFNIDLLLAKENISFLELVYRSFIENYYDNMIIVEGINGDEQPFICNFCINPIHSRHIYYARVYSQAQLMYLFRGANTHFFRGKYPILHEQIIELNPQSFTYIYNATAMKKSQLDKCQLSYNFVLCPDPKMIQIFKEIYQYSSIILYVKCPPYSYLSPFNNISTEREYDCIFIARSKQTTKNVHIIQSILELNDNIKFLLLIADIQIYDSSFFGKLCTTYKKHIKLIDNFADDIKKYYNMAKCLFICSGRDDVPRIIPEATSMGCYCIVLDTLSNGLWYLSDNFLDLLPETNKSNYILGEIFKVSKFEYTKHSSTSAILSRTEIKRLLQLFRFTYNHKDISKISKFLLNPCKNKINLLKDGTFKNIHFAK